MKTQKNKQTQNKTKKIPKETHNAKQKQKIKERERVSKKKKKKKVTLQTRHLFPNDFSHVVYLFLHQNLLSTIHLRY